jgi:hypothetical protein
MNDHPHFHPNFLFGSSLSEQARFHHPLPMYALLTTLF